MAEDDTLRAGGKGNTSRRRKVGAPSNVFDTEAFLTTVGAGRTIASYKKNEVIFHQGTECDSVYYVQKGDVGVNVVSSEGKERVVGILGAGAFIAESCLAGHPRHLASARALTPAIVARIEKATLVATMSNHPELSQRFMTHLLLRNSQVEADLVDQLFNSSEKRLARLLIMLSQVGHEAEMRVVPAPISQEVLAARIGTTRPRVSHFMNKFRKLGLIEYNGHLKVHSALLNVIIRE